MMHEGRPKLCPEGRGSCCGLVVAVGLAQAGLDQVDVKAGGSFAAQQHKPDALGGVAARPGFKSSASPATHEPAGGVAARLPAPPPPARPTHAAGQRVQERGRRGVGAARKAPQHAGGLPPAHGARVGAGRGREGAQEGRLGAPAGAQEGGGGDVAEQGATGGGGIVTIHGRQGRSATAARAYMCVWRGTVRACVEGDGFGRWCPRQAARGLACRYCGCCCGCCCSLCSLCQ